MDWFGYYYYGRRLKAKKCRRLQYLDLVREQREFWSLGSHADKGLAGGVADPEICWSGRRRKKEVYDHYYHYQHTFLSIYMHEPCEQCLGAGRALVQQRHEGGAERGGRGAGRGAHRRLHGAQHAALRFSARAPVHAGHFDYQICNTSFKTSKIRHKRKFLSSQRELTMWRQEFSFFFPAGNTLLKSVDHFEDYLAQTDRETNFRNCIISIIRHNVNNCLSTYSLLLMCCQPLTKIKKVIIEPRVLSLTDWNASKVTYYITPIICDNVVFSRSTRPIQTFTNEDTS